MNSLKTLWDNDSVAKPFIVQDVNGNYFLCQNACNNDYFLGIRIEVDPLDPSAFRTVKSIILPGNDERWELV